MHHLWVQEKVENKDISVAKVAGTENPSDIGTKFVSQEVMAKHLKKLGFG